MQEDLQLFIMHLPRFKPKDFKTKKFDNVAEDWPISYKDLEKYYELNEKNNGSSGLKNDPEYPKIKKLLPPVNLDFSGKIIQKSFKNLIGTVGHHIAELLQKK